MVLICGDTTQRSLMEGNAEIEVGPESGPECAQSLKLADGISSPSPHVSVGVVLMTPELLFSRGDILPNLQRQRAIGGSTLRLLSPQPSKQDLLLFGPLALSLLHQKQKPCFVQFISVQPCQKIGDIKSGEHFWFNHLFSLQRLVGKIKVFFHAGHANQCNIVPLVIDFKPKSTIQIIISFSQKRHIIISLLRKKIPLHGKVLVFLFTSISSSQVEIPFEGCIADFLIQQTIKYAWILEQVPVKRPQLFLKLIC